MRAVPMAEAERCASTTRRSVSDSPGARMPSGYSPSSPPVAYTTTTRCPSSTARASVPDVMMHSSSGWAWKATMVAIATSLSRDGAGLAQLCDAVGVEAGLGEDLVRVLARVRRRAGDLARRAAEAGRGARLGDPGDVDERPPGDVVRVL